MWKGKPTKDHFFDQGEIHGRSFTSLTMVGRTRCYVTPTLLAGILMEAHAGAVLRRSAGDVCIARLIFEDVTRHASVPACSNQRPVPTRDVVRCAQEAGNPASQDMLNRPFVAAWPHQLEAGCEHVSVSLGMLQIQLPGI